MPSKTKSSKQKDPRKEEKRQNANEFHADVTDMSSAISNASLSRESGLLFHELQAPRPMDETNITISKLAAMAGTNLSHNERDPYGNGDQTGCGEIGMEGEPMRQILRSLFAEGADLDSYLCYNGFSPFALACGTGNVPVATQMLEATDFGSMERTHLLELRETGMRFAPLCLTVALYKAKSHVAMRLNIPESRMNHSAILKLLLRYGAAPDCKDMTGKTIIHYAAGSFAMEDTLEMADFCIEAAKSCVHFNKDVTLRNLVKDQYNGQTGTLGGYFADSGRREVILKDGTQLSLKPTNIFFVQEGAVNGEKCVYDGDRKLVNDQDRTGMISLHEVFPSARVDVARFLTHKHNVSIDIEDRGKTSVRSMAYTSFMVSEMTNLIRKYGSKHTGIQCIMCGKSDGKIFQCSRCRVANYCSKKCQKMHWGEHKNSCVSQQEKIVTLTTPATNRLAPVDINGDVEDLNYGRPDGIKVDEQFLIKVQISAATMEEANDKMYGKGLHKIYDKSKTCHFYVYYDESGYSDIRERVLGENAYMGRKAYFKASFGNDGNCTIFLDKTALKTW